MKQAQREMQWSASNAEIERLCSYIKSDHSIAAYLGVDVQRVTNVRSGIRQTDTKIFRESRYEPEGHRGGTNVHLIAEQDAQDASARLLLAYDLYFERFERRHGLRPGAGKILAPAGWDGFVA